MSDFAAFVGIDWSDKKHDLCLVEAATGRLDPLIHQRANLRLISRTVVSSPHVYPPPQHLAFTTRRECEVMSLVTATG